MTAQLLDGKSLSQHYREQFKQQLSTHPYTRPPGLAVVIIGDDPASHLYVHNKQKACEAIGLHSRLIHLPEKTQEQDCLSIIDKLNQDEAIDGILVQLPLPEHIDPNKVFGHIDPYKDVDGFHPYNMGRLVQKNPLFRPCTPMGIMKLLQHYAIPLTGLNATIIGTSIIVGRPMALELLMENVTVTLCHRHTKNLQEHIQKADLLISAIGKPGVIQTNWIKDNAIIIDVGTTLTDDQKIIGDINFESACEKASWITPVPGGVGPMTVTCLLENTLTAWKLTLDAK